VLSTTPKGYQTVIDMLQNFCKDKDLTINVSKTKFMVVKGKTHDAWTYNQGPIKSLGSYKKLALSVTSRRHFSKCCASQLTVSAKNSQHGLFSNALSTM
jgi:hypothetical protein